MKEILRQLKGLIYCFDASEEYELNSVTWLNILQALHNWSLALYEYSTNAQNCILRIVEVQMESNYVGLSVCNCRYTGK